MEITSEKENNKYTLNPPSFSQRVKEALSIITAQRVSVIGLSIILAWIFIAIFAPVITRYGPLEEDSNALNQGPSLQHPLGTDHKGRDIWSRIAYGSRIVLVLAPISVGVALIIGISLGLVAGYYGKWVDESVMRVVDLIMAFPAILLYLIIISTLGASAMNVVIAITIAGAPGIARLVRGLTMDIRTRDYIAAAKLRGESTWHILLKETLPNARGPLIVDSALRVGYTIFAIGTLGFLGLGLPPPAPDWGSMVNAGRRYIWDNPWAVVWPCLAIASLVIALNLLADGLQKELGKYG